MKIESEILKIIENGKSEGNLYFLPPTQLDRKVYANVNKILEALGGKWSRQKKAHVFESPIDDAINNVILTGEVVSRKQELQLFETTDNVADQLCELAELKDGQSVCEPEAGKGKIIRAILRRKIAMTIFWCEIDSANAAFIEENIHRGGFLGGDFLSRNLDSGTFDRIIMNPPFSMNGSGSQTDIDHVTHALKFLNENGILVSVMSPAIKSRTNRKTNEFRALLENYHHEIIDLPDGAFKESGTMIKTVILKARK